MKKLYFDLDGVLADFDGRVAMLAAQNNMLVSQMTKSMMWKMIYRDRDFFFQLDFIPEAHALWDYAKRHNPIILTGLPSRVEGKEHKIAWVKKILGDYETIVVPKVEKQKYAKPGAVLVDDTPINIEQWAAQGGHGILHAKPLLNERSSFAYDPAAYATTLATLQHVMEG